jgi:hypothetical protein
MIGTTPRVGFGYRPPAALHGFCRKVITVGYEVWTEKDALIIRFAALLKRASAE